MDRIDQSGLNGPNGLNRTELTKVHRMDQTGPNRVNWTELTEIDRMDRIELKWTEVDQIGPKLTKVD